MGVLKIVRKGCGFRCDALQCMNTIVILNRMFKAVEKVVVSDDGCGTS